MSNIPKLRFKEFSGEWEETKLGDVSKIIMGQSPDSSSYNENYIGIPLIQGNADCKNRKTKPRTYTSMKTKECLIDDIIMTVRAPVGAISKSFHNACIGRGVCSIRAKDDNNFLYQFLIKYENKWKKYSQGSTFTAVNSSDIRNLKLNLPQKQEQQKIASFLTSIDTRIEQLTKKRQLLEEYKKGIMQKIFSQEIRFKCDDGREFGDWEVKRLKDILDYEQPTKYIVESVEYNNSYKTPVLTAGKTFVLGYTNEIHGIYKNLPVIIFDDFTTANHYVDFDFKVKSSAMKILKTKDKEVNLKFIYELIQMLHFPLGEHKRYWISEYSYLRINLPQLKEQIKIANFLSSIDKKIEFTTTQLNQTKKFKKGLLQQMFV